MIFRILIGLLMGGYSVITGLSIVTDSNCNSVSFGGQGRQIILTCYTSGMSGGQMPGILAGLLAIALGLTIIAFGIYPILEANGHSIDSILNKLNGVNGAQSKRTKVANNPSTYSNPKSYDRQLAYSVTTSVEQLEALSNSRDLAVLYGVIQNPNTPVEILNRLSMSPTSEVRQEVAEQTNDSDLLHDMAFMEKDDNVLLAIVDNDNVKEETLFFLVKMIYKTDNHDYSELAEAIALSENASQRVLDLLFKDYTTEVLVNANFDIDKTNIDLTQVDIFTDFEINIMLDKEVIHKNLLIKFAESTENKELLYEIYSDDNFTANMLLDALENPKIRHKEIIAEKIITTDKLNDSTRKSFLGKVFKGFSIKAAVLFVISLVILLLIFLVGAYPIAAAMIAPMFWLLLAILYFVLNKIITKSSNTAKKYMDLHTDFSQAVSEIKKNKSNSLKGNSIYKNYRTKKNILIIFLVALFFIIPTLIGLASMAFVNNPTNIL
jgi:hypothetical protein